MFTTSTQNCVLIKIELIFFFLLLMSVAIFWGENDLQWGFMWIWGRLGLYIDWVSAWFFRWLSSIWKFVFCPLKTSNLSFNFWKCFKFLWICPQFSKVSKFTSFLCKISDQIERILPKIRQFSWVQTKISQNLFSETIPSRTKVVNLTVTRHSNHFPRNCS